MICDACRRERIKLDAPRRMKAPKSIPTRVKLLVVVRDGLVCQACGCDVHLDNPRADDRLHFDHIYPVCHGGKSTVDNIQVLCRRCNRKKGTSIPKGAKK